MKTLFALTALVFLWSLPAWAEIAILDPYARIIGSNGVVYFAVRNTGTTDDVLLSAQSPLGMAMLMTSAQDATGMMQMRPVPDGFIVRAGEVHLLAPAADHVMLSGIAARPDAAFLLILTFGQSGDILVTVPVDNHRRSPPTP